MKTFNLLYDSVCICTTAVVKAHILWYKTIYKEERDKTRMIRS